MKILFLILLVSLSFNGFSQKISIEKRTLNISKNGRISEIAFFNDHFYIMYQTSRRNTSAYFSTIKVYDIKGRFVENVFLPKEAISMPYSDLRVNNQRLYLTQEHSFQEISFLLEKYVANFNKTDDTLINIYEDSDYVAYPNCNGEWGASTYFQNKHDSSAYEFYSSCKPNIIRTEDGYLIVGGKKIDIIKDPSKLYHAKLIFDICYKDRYNIGVDTFFVSDYSISSAVKINGKLNFIYSDSVNSFIGEIKNGKLVSKHAFKKGYHFSRWFKDTDKSQVLSIYTYTSIGAFGYMKGYKRVGFLLINEGKFKMYYIK